MVPFGGSEHDWAALEIAAWAAAAEGKALRLVGSGGEGPESKDASRLLANTSLVVQRLVGVAVEPVLVEPSVQGLIEAAGEADLVAMGLPERWRSKGLGEVRAALARSLRSPVLLTKRGLSSVGIAPQRESLTRFTWTSPPVGGR
jgi:nucleotide-binding universal stress UspA family protein